MRLQLICLAVVLGLASLAAAQDPGFPSPGGLLEDGTCDLRGLKCFRPGSKCNIKFKNRTGIVKSTCGSGSPKSTAQAKIVQVSARLGDKRVGNKRSINAGASVTLNLTKRVESGGFDRIRVEAVDALVQRVVLQCYDVLEILKADAGCSVSYDSKDDPYDGKRHNFLVVSCDNGELCYRPSGASE